MSKRILVTVTIVLVSALGIGFATASFVSRPSGGNQGHTMPNGQSMSGGMSMSNGSMGGMSMGTTR